MNKSMKLAFSFFLLFVGFSTEKILDDIVSVQKQNAADGEKRGSSEESKSAEKYVVLERVKGRSKIFGSLVLNLVKSYSNPEESLKMAMTDAKWSSMKITGTVKLFPSGSSIKAIYDLGANTIFWEGRTDLIPNEIKEQIQRAICERDPTKGEEEVANALFDCFFAWLPITKDTEETNSADSEEMLTFVREIMFRIAKDVDIERKEKRKESTPLMLATIFDAKKAIVELFRRGAEPNVVNKEGNTALHWASRENELLCEILLQTGANINFQNKSGKTALMIAAKFGRIKVVRFLLQSGAVTEMRDNDGKTAEELGTRTCANVIRYYRHW